MSETKKIESIKGTLEFRRIDPKSVTVLGKALKSLLVPCNITDREFYQMVGGIFFTIAKLRMRVGIHFGEMEIDVWRIKGSPFSSPVIPQGMLAMDGPSRNPKF